MLMMQGPQFPNYFLKKTITTTYQNGDDMENSTSKVFKKETTTASAHHNCIEDVQNSPKNLTSVIK